ncbi:MAG: hypothetical protein R6X32_00885 [Chloroflexota bacterium]
MFINSDFSDLLRIFNDNNVKYLVIGGYAVTQYAEPRFTKDLDLWVSTGPANAAAVYKALREFGAPLADMTDLPVFFISRQDLITAKQASGRPQDLIDADLLSQVEDE